MFDKFNQILSFAADPPDGSGGTKAAVGAPLLEDTTNPDPPPPADPPDGSGGTGPTTPSTS